LRETSLPLEPLGGGQGGRKFDWFEGNKKRLGERRIDLNASDIEAVAAAAFSNRLAYAMITRGGVASAIMRLQGWDQWGRKPAMAQLPDICSKS
jgi:hypothetical protein